MFFFCTDILRRMAPFKTDPLLIQYLLLHPHKDIDWLFLKM